MDLGYHYTAKAQIVVSWKGEEIKEKIIKKVIPEKMLDDKTVYHVCACSNYTLFDCSNHLSRSNPPVSSSSVVLRVMPV